MAIPPFTICGLLPPGIHDATLSETSSIFAPPLNKHRKQLWDGLIRFLNMLHAKGALECVQAIYIDGSYTTDKKRPSDIDIIFEIDPSAEAESYACLLVSTANESVKRTFGVHPFVHVLGFNKTNMVDFFQRIKEHDAMDRDIKLLPKTAQKGIIRTYYE